MFTGNSIACQQPGHVVLLYYKRSLDLDQQVACIIDVLMLLMLNNSVRGGVRFLGLVLLERA